MQENNCSLSEAQRILWEPRGGQASPWSDSAVKTPQKRSASENSADEAKLSASPSGYKPLDGDENVQACVVNLKPGAGGSVLMCCPAQGLRDFSLDYVLDEASGQHEAYNAVAAEQVDHFLAGNDVCIFAYGQTGSGKTHSMFGAGEEGGGGLREGGGVVQEVCKQVFERLKEGEGEGEGSEGGRVLSFAMVEVYGETVVDLLADGEGGKEGGREVGHREVIGGKRHREVRSEQELVSLLREGMARRRRAATAMNERSSRAHCLVMLKAKQPSRAEAEGSGEKKAWGAARERGREHALCLADLGGSEQVSKSLLSALPPPGLHAEGSGAANVRARADDVDVRLGEAIRINVGLLALKNCVRALVDKRPHVPYRDSKLTLLLKQALGGTCRTSVLVALRAEREHALESIDSLRFAASLSQVRNQLQTDCMGVAEEALRELDLRIAEVEGLIQKNEHWLTTTHSRPDPRYQEGEATAASEVVSKTALVGAERERRELEELLARRLVLTQAT